MLGQCLLVSLMTVTLAPVPAPKKKIQAPTTDAPLFALVTNVNPVDNVITCHMKRVVYVVHARTMVIEQNGQRINKIVQVIRPHVTVVVRKHMLTKAKLYNGAGKELSAKDVAPNLRGKIIVLHLNFQKKGMSPAYFKVLSKDAIVMVVRK